MSDSQSVDRSPRVLRSDIPPGPGRLGSIGPMLSLCHDRIHPVVNAHRDYGSIVMLRAAINRLYFVNEPDAVQELLSGCHRDVVKDTGHQLFLRPILRNGLLLNEGVSHLKQRRMMQPAFHMDRIAAYGKIMAAYASRTAEEWTAGQRIDMMHEMMSLALDIVCKCLFNSEVKNDKEAVAASIEDIMEADSLLLHPLNFMLMKLPVRRVRRFRRALKRLDAVVYRIIDEHRASGEEEDLLGMLMASRDEETGERMDVEALRDEVLTLFLAGHETTANTMAWAWRLLAEHPEVEARFHQELDEALGGRTPAMADTANLPYTRQIVEETLRLYPPAYFFGREAKRPITIQGYAIPAGAQVLLSPYVTHRDPRFFPDPDKFDPDRFTTAIREQRPRDAFFPFGAGPRKCIGERFAMMEAMLVLATIGQRWAVSTGGNPRPDIDPRITLRPRGGMPMVVQRRKTD